MLNAIRAVALLLEEMEETQINGFVKEAFDSQITEYTSDMKSLIEDARDRLDQHFKTTEGRLTQLIDKAAAQQQQGPQHVGRQSQPATYASTLTNPPPHANPRIAAKEGIKARQFLLEGIANTKFSHTDVLQLKAELNNILTGLGLKDGKIRSINKLRNGGALLEMDSDDATTWLTVQENRNKFSNKIGPEAVFRARVHSLIAFNVPLAITPESQSHRQEICEANSLDKEEITSMRWAKPIHRRTPEQRTAHLILTFSSADAANRAITNGLYICSRRCHAERVKREPTRCLKCQGWNHFARECLEEDDKCSNCTKNHRTSDCLTPEVRRCVSCNSGDHASWSRECPTFIKKLNDLNERNPENALQYIPTADPWTWTANAQALPQSQQIRPNLARANHGGDRTQYTKKAPPRRYDSYVPDDVYIPTDSYVPNYDRAGKRVQRASEKETDVPKDPVQFQPMPQQYMNTINEDPRRPVDPVPVQPF